MCLIFIFLGGFSSIDWSVRLSDPPTSGSGGSMPAANGGESTAMGTAAATAAPTHSSGGVLSRRQSSVLENRDLCRMISSYVPARIVK